MSLTVKWLSLISHFNGSSHSSSLCWSHIDVCQMLSIVHLKYKWLQAAPQTSPLNSIDSSWLLLFALNIILVHLNIAQSFIELRLTSFTYSRGGQTTAHGSHVARHRSHVALKIIQKYANDRQKGKQVPNLKIFY